MIAKFQTILIAINEITQKNVFLSFSCFFFAFFSYSFGVAHIFCFWISKWPGFQFFALFCSTCCHFSLSLYFELHVNCNCINMQSCPLFHFLVCFLFVCVVVVFCPFFSHFTFLVVQCNASIVCMIFERHCVCQCVVLIPSVIFIVSKMCVSYLCFACGLYSFLLFFFVFWWTKKCKITIELIIESKFNVQIINLINENVQTKDYLRCCWFLFGFQRLEI